MNLQKSRLLLLTLAIVVGGCGYASKQVAPEVKPGANVQINQAFEALRNGSTIYFQNGTNLPRKQLDKWSTYCALYVYNDEFGADYVTSVQPGNFQVARSLNGREIVDSSPLDGIKLAGSIGLSGHDLPSYIIYRTRLDLWSPDQPDVKSITCSRKAGNYGDYYPRFEEMQAALGDLVRINR